MKRYHSSFSSMSLQAGKLLDLSLISGGLESRVKLSQTLDVEKTGYPGIEFNPASESLRCLLIQSLLEEIEVGPVGFTCSRREVRTTLSL